MLCFNCLLTFNHNNSPSIVIKSGIWVTCEYGAKQKKSILLSNEVMFAQIHINTPISIENLNSFTEITIQMLLSIQKSSSINITKQRILDHWWLG